MSKFQKAVIVLLSLIACSIAVLFFLLLRLSTLQAPSPPQPTVTAGPTPTPIVLKFEGEGDDLVFFDAPLTGAALFGFAHRGDSNFIVKLFKADGALLEVLINEIGDYDGKKATQLPKGRYMLEVTAAGDWFVVILPPQ